MKRFLIYALCLLVFIQVEAQEKEDSKKKKQIEIGVLTNSVFNNINLSEVNFKIGSENVFFRTGVTALDISSNESRLDTIKRNTSRFEVGVSLGPEFRSRIKKKITFRNGPQFLFSYSDTKTDQNSLLRNSEVIRLGISYFIGFSYELRNRFLVGAELTPVLMRYTVEKNRWENLEETREFIRSDFNRFLSIRNIQMSLIYKIRG